jgi:hypothetical protein
MEAVVLHTNVAAYHLIRAQGHQDVLSSLFLSDLEFVAPESLKAEIMNVLWLAIRHANLPVHTRIILDVLCPIAPYLNR